MYSEIFYLGKKKKKNKQAFKTQIWINLQRKTTAEYPVKVFW